LVEVKNDVISDKRSEGGWRKLHNDELHNLYSSLNIVTIISKKTRWAEHVKYMRGKRNVHEILLVNPKEPKGMGGRVIIKFILDKQK
jgi:hypothetical protein